MNFSPTKQKEPLTWVEVNGKTKAPVSYTHLTLPTTERV